MCESSNVFSSRFMENVPIVFSSVLLISSCSIGIELFGNVSLAIWFLRNSVRTRHGEPIEDEYVLQEYLSHPFLVDGYKFDIRLFVLVWLFGPFPLLHLWFYTPYSLTSLFGLGSCISSYCSFLSLGSPSLIFIWSVESYSKRSSHDWTFDFDFIGFRCLDVGGQFETFDRSCESWLFPSFFFRTLGGWSV